MAHLSQQLIPNWLKISDVVRTGKPSCHVNQEKDGEEFFAGFVEAIFSLSYAAAQKFGEHLGVAKTTTPINVLDIGAGSGVWGVALVQQSPKVRVRSVDWPRVLDITEKVARKFGVTDRLTKAPGDLLEADFGTGHQIATIGHILHSEGVERSRRLLKRTFDALAPGGTIAIMEFVPNDDRTGPAMPLIFSVNMLVNTDEGDTFTFPEISAWLREAGFINARLLEVPAVSPLILATKP
jgi:cyclopropane fatty-acyl-phospholipid synthase-like methyltransferase